MIFKSSMFVKVFVRSNHILPCAISFYGYDTGWTSFSTRQTENCTCLYRVLQPLFFMRQLLSNKQFFFLFRLTWFGFLQPRSSGAGVGGIKFDFAIICIFNFIINCFASSFTLTMVLLLSWSPTPTAQLPTFVGTQKHPRHSKIRKSK